MDESVTGSANFFWSSADRPRHLYNDEANAAMRGINARLGYVPQPPTILVRGPLG
jgi:hypothetical protein